MCGDYDSVIGMNKETSINRFLKNTSDKYLPANGEATICGAVVDMNINTGLANNIKSFIYGGDLKEII